MVNALKILVVHIQLHSVQIRLSSKTEGFVVVSRSTLDPYHDDLLYVCVINSSLSGFSSWVTVRYETLVVYVLSSRLAGYDQKLTQRVWQT